MPQEAAELETTRLSRLLRRLLDEVDKGNKQDSSMDVGFLLFVHSVHYIKVWIYAEV